MRGGDSSPHRVGEPSKSSLLAVPQAATKNKKPSSKPLKHAEELYKDSFQFFRIEQEVDEEKLRDYLYKISFNLSDAARYNDLTKALYQIDETNDPNDLVSMLYQSSLQSYLLALRRIVDKASERNLRGLINIVCTEEYKEKWLPDLDRMYSGINVFIDNVMAHQGKKEFSQVIVLPNLDVMDKDLTLLIDVYMTISSSVCSKYLKVAGLSNKFIENLKQTLA